MTAISIPGIIYIICTVIILLVFIIFLINPRWFSKAGTPDDPKFDGEIQFERYVKPGETNETLNMTLVIYRDPPESIINERSVTLRVYDLDKWREENKHHNRTDK